VHRNQQKPKRQSLTMKVLPILFLFACWLGANLSGWAQSFGIQNINSTRGLRNNSVWGIGQDAEGFIWMASAHGLQRFDGNSFQTLSRKEGLADSEAMDFFPNPLTGELYVQVYPGKASVLKNGVIDRTKGRNLERLFSSRSLLNISVNRSQKTLFVIADQHAYETDFDFRI
jgi:ligand-binding sensor domain-containing protein